MKLVAENITVKAQNSALVENASFSLLQGRLTALLGPNGAGKTTLLRAAMGLSKPEAGQVLIDGEDVQSLSPMRRARRVAYLPQRRPMAWPNTVRDVVALGRYSHGASLGRLKSKDAEAVDSAIEACDIVSLAHRKTDTLSGGEMARVHCARAFAAQAPLLIADEPVAALDPLHQFRVMDLLKDYTENGRGVLVVLHDISLAARYADHLIWMKDGRILADGSPEDTLTENRLADVYGVKSRVKRSKVTIEGAL
ncbi:ABC transporter ATP-binding protein [Litorimonas sp.]|uniref:ABC transporter ATP-binding protein n=1 Tax=Litorimonas sp. TaxID=1892381 RepID=UPI003A87B764